MNTHACALAHWFVMSQGVRQRSSVAQVRPWGQGTAPLQSSSVGSSQTPFVPETTQMLPGGQSDDSMHALWQWPNAQMSGLSQSLLMEQVADRPPAE